MLSASGALSLDPTMLDAWAETVARHYGAVVGRYGMTQPDKQGLYVLVVEGDIMAKEISLYLAGLPIRHAATSRMGVELPTYDQLIREGSEQWPRLYTWLTHLYLNGHSS